VESCISKSHNVTLNYTLHICMAYPFSIWTYGLSTLFSGRNNHLTEDIHENWK